mmetsp:Transcript_126490/g.393719  ORF Transcript_126490/g.393719 Transcript_126490/m.393719 type:complete len:348 (+) Transcript_126490:59-1102(+)
MMRLGAWHVAVISFGLATTVEANRHLARGVSSTAHAGHDKIVPKLSPKSDPHFFGHDYPDDYSPLSPVEKDFSHPYPVVQESDTYDKDYVKDENADNGEWKAQWDYDRLRTRMENLRADEAKIIKKKKELEKKLEAFKSKKHQLDEEANATEEKSHMTEEEAKSEVERAKANKDHFKPVQVNESMDGDTNASVAVGVRKASDKVLKELKDIEECKRQLAEAQAKLKKLHEEIEKADAKDKDSQKKKETALEEEAASKAREAETEAELKETEEKHGLEDKEYREEAEKLHEMEAKFDKAEARLRKFRGEVDQNGGVYRSDTGAKSGASHRAPLLWTSALLAACSLSRG